ncbi:MULTISPECIES: hypothetical protein [unclassified Lactobacillus]|nr:MULTISPECIES: hypothetical protein [unclassified Lactobacillus]
MVIISEKHQEIANKIDLKINRDFTYLNVHSDYSLKKTCQLFNYLVVSPRKISTVRQLIAAEDTRNS